MTKHVWTLTYARDSVSRVARVACAVERALPVGAVSVQVTVVSVMLMLRSKVINQTLIDIWGKIERNHIGELQSWPKVVGTMLTEYEFTSYCFTSRLPLTLWCSPLLPNQCWCELVAVTYCVQLIFQHRFGGGGKLVSSQHFWQWL